MRGRELLSVEQRNELLRLVLSNTEELAMYYTFSEYDIEVINRHRRDHNRLGFAIQLCTLRHPGCSLVDLPEKVPEMLVRFVAKQIGVDPTVFNIYAKRDPTRREHLEEIRKEYGYRSFQLNDYRIISSTLLQHALENGNTMYLIQTTINLLRKRKIIIPALPTIERLVWETRKRAEKKIFMTLTNSLSDWQKRKLDELIASSIDNKKTLLAWLKEIPGQSSPDAFLKVIKRWEYVRDLKLSINIREIHPNRLLQLARIGARYDAYSFRSFKDSNKRYAILVAFLLTLGQDLIDQAIEIHDRQMLILQSKGRKQQEEIQKQNGKLINEKVVQFADIGSALIKAKEEGLNPFEILESIMPWEKIVESVEEAKR